MLELAGAFLGGLGLFLLAVALITDGLKLAAGQALRSILQSSTRTRLRGVASGVLVTAIVQSSSAVTVAIIGFVNAGLVSLAQALGIVYGANIGTTMTGWIVALVGFNFKIDAYALPLIGIGMALRLVRPGTRLAALGQAVAGFGLFFIGVDVLRNAFESVAAQVDVASFAPQGGLGIVLYVTLGFFMTVLTQSSSAAIAITLTAATGGVLSVNIAAAMVIGANLGTTSTAAFAVIGATANARRVAAAHVAFNLLTALVALALLPVLMWLVATTGKALGLADIPAVTLALFHTVFNVLGLIIMWPLSNPLARFLSRRFTTEDELLARPRYLDRNVMATPDLAMEAIKRELDRVAVAARENAVAVISAESTGRAAEQQQGVLALLEAIETFTTDLEMRALPEARRGDLPNVLRICGYLEEISGLVGDVQAHRQALESLLRSPASAAVAAYQAEVVAQLQACAAIAEGPTAVEQQAGFDALRERYHALKSQLLEDAARRRVPIAGFNQALEGLRDMLKMAEQMTKVAQRLRTLDTRAVATASAASDGGADRSPDVSVGGAGGGGAALASADPAAAADTGAQRTDGREQA